MRNLLIELILTLTFVASQSFAQDVPPPSVKVQQNPSNDVYFGNLHVHTSYSFDGYTNGSVTIPDDAYRWAKGEAINGGGDGSKLKILKPLDWYAVSDHAEYLGLFKKMEDPSSQASKIEMAKRILSKDQVIAFSNTDYRTTARCAKLNNTTPQFFHRVIRTYSGSTTTFDRTPFQSNSVSPMT